MATALQNSTELAIEGIFKTMELNLLNSTEAVAALSAVMLSIVSKDAPDGIAVRSLGFVLSVKPEEVEEDAE